MWIRIVVFSQILICLLGACQAGQPLEPQTAHPLVRRSWQQDRHGVWELEWPAMPGGPVTVESWQAGSRYRFEILEATAPALLGQVLVFDGQQAWRYNRFAPPASFRPTRPRLAPMTEALAIIDQLLERRPVSAWRAPASVNFQPAEQIHLVFTGGDSLTLWRDQASGLPVRVRFVSGGQQATLEARQIEPLVDPPPGLFEVGPWLGEGR